MKTGIFYAVGVGTEPLDLTLRAKQVLETAEVLVTPITRAVEPSAAARIAEQVVSFSGKEIIPLLFPMQKHLDYRERLRGELLQPVRDCLQAGKRVAMVTLGDVSIYSTAAYVAAGARSRWLCNGSGCWYLCLFCRSSKGKVQLMRTAGILDGFAGRSSTRNHSTGIGAVRHIGADESRKSVAMARSHVAGTAAAGTHHDAAKYRHGRGMDWNANRRADLLFYHSHHPPSTEQIKKGNRNNGLFCRSWSR